MSITNICVDELRVGPETRLSLADKIVMVLKRAACTLDEWQRRRVERRHLLYLDDYLLKDIGISRADAEFEARKPFWRK